MDKEEFTEKVKKALEEGVYPDEDGRPSKLSEEDIDDMLETYNYIIDAMLERRQEFLTEENLVQATADRIWTADEC